MRFKWTAPSSHGRAQSYSETTPKQALLATPCLARTQRINSETLALREYPMRRAISTTRSRVAREIFGLLLRASETAVWDTPARTAMRCVLIRKRIWGLRERA